MAKPPLLTLTDIALTFGGDPLFEDLSLIVSEGERAALVGRNGSGKSTLMKIMADLVAPDDGTRFLRPGAHVAYLEQDPDVAAFATLGEFASEGLPASEAYRAEIAMEGLSLDPARDPATASGGERRRAALARLIASDADLMLIDEPTNHLDISAILWLENWLAETRKAFVLISHDRAFLSRLTRSMIWVDRGRVRQQARGFTQFEDWRDKTFEEEDAERHKRGRLIKAEARWAVEGISGRRKRNMGRVRRLQELRAEHAAERLRTGPADFALSEGRSSGKLVIEARGISKSFEGAAVLRDFDLKMLRGDRIGIVGPNGVGKTTLLKILTKEIEPDAGQVRHGVNLEIAVFDQTRESLDGDTSLWETLSEDPELGVKGKNDQVMVRGKPRHVVSYLKDFLFSDEQVRSPVRALSGGEKARLLMARIMARESNLLVLDEPTNDLDVETLDLLQDVLGEYPGTVIIVSHDRDFLDRVVTQTIAMEGRGRVEVHAGGYSDYLARLPAEAEAAPARKTQKPKVEPPEKKPPPVKEGLTYAEAHRLEVLPEEMARLEAEIAKLQEFLSDPDLFATAPAKFEKASAALVERQTTLEAAEEEWLDLEERAAG